MKLNLTCVVLGTKATNLGVTKYFILYPKPPQTLSLTMQTVVSVWLMMSASLRVGP